MYFVDMDKDVLVSERITEEIAVGMLHIQLWNGFKQIANWGFKMAWRRTFCRGKQIANVIS